MPASGRPLPPARGPAPARQRVLLVDDPRRLDSLTACRRIAAHLPEMDLLRAADRTATADAPPPDAALVCDLPDAARELTEQGVPVVYLHSGHQAELPATAAAVRLLHVPAWLPGPKPAGGAGVRSTGLLAPARLARSRSRAGCLLLVSAYGVRAADLTGIAARTLRPLAEEAAGRTGRCDVVCDVGTEHVREALAPLAQVRVRPAAEVDVDALHTEAAVFLASPTLTALSLAQPRRAPLAFLPPLGPAQADLARRTAQIAPVGTVGDAWEPGRGPLYAPDAPSPWSGIDAGADDLRGAQRVARSIRQLALAPTAF
ncbi:CGA synthase-related protein [Streptomyces sp. NPDC101393]|uniref:CGA synthase-related protein n=1 Tax=Streptomyces sp. NPDC101393 TaxID=3366141 RepID=UPI0038226C3D